jgi:hypothetical protein
MGLIETIAVTFILMVAIVILILMLMYLIEH